MMSEGFLWPKGWERYNLGCNFYNPGCNGCGWFVLEWSQKPGGS